MLELNTVVPDFGPGIRPFFRNRAVRPSPAPAKFLAGCGGCHAVQCLLSVNYG